MARRRTTRLMAALSATLLLANGGAAAQVASRGDPGNERPGRSTLILGCWGDADKGDGAELKLAFHDDGSMVQYDENQQERRRRTFGAWQMQKDSTYLVVYWSNGSTTSYTVKRIGRILHFQGLYGVRNFTLREIESRNCWVPKE